MFARGCQAVYAAVCQAGRFLVIISPASPAIRAFSRPSGGEPKVPYASDGCAITPYHVKIRSGDCHRRPPVLYYCQLGKHCAFACTLRAALLLLPFAFFCFLFFKEPISVGLSNKLDVKGRKNLARGEPVQRAHGAVVAPTLAGS